MRAEGRRETLKGGKAAKSLRWKKRLSSQRRSPRIKETALNGKLKLIKARQRQLEQNNKRTFLYKSNRRSDGKVGKKEKGVRGSGMLEGMIRSVLAATGAVGKKRRKREKGHFQGRGKET